MAASNYGILYDPVTKQIRQMIVADSDKGLTNAMKAWPDNSKLTLPLKDKKLFKEKTAERIGDAIEDEKPPINPPPVPPAEDWVVICKFHSDGPHEWTDKEKETLAKYGIKV